MRARNIPYTTIQKIKKKTVTVLDASSSLNATMTTAGPPRKITMMVLFQKRKDLNWRMRMNLKAFVRMKKTVKMKAFLYSKFQQ